MRKTRITSVVGAALAVVAVAGAVGAPAAAAARPVLLDTDLGASGPYRAPAECGGVVGVSTTIGSVTYLVEASAEAVSTNGSLAVGTTVRCVVYDAQTGEVYGRVAGGLPGSYAVAVGPVTVPLSSNPAICVSSSAVFNDGGSYAGKPCP